MVDHDDDDYGDGYSDGHGEEEDGHDNDDQLIYLLDVVILHGLLHPAEQIPFWGEISLVANSIGQIYLVRIGFGTSVMVKMMISPRAFRPDKWRERLTQNRQCQELFGSPTPWEPKVRIASIQLRYQDQTMSKTKIVWFLSYLAADVSEILTIPTPSLSRSSSMLSRSSNTSVPSFSPCLSAPVFF